MGKLLSRLNQGGTLLQVALDFTRITDAIRVLRTLTDLPIDIYEVGTPLIKSEGVKSIEIVRALVGNDKLVLADMKTADTGALEVELAYSAGADVATVLASADNEVINAALQKASELDMDIVVDTIGVDDVFRRIRELRTMNVRIVNIHTGIDVQRAKQTTAASRVTVIREIVTTFSNMYVAASGGIKAPDVPRLLEAGVSIVVVGSAITKSSDPRKSATEIINILKSRG
ncbi:MAG: orotidine 5'-phosphate decarboxylase [Desulfurococcales archaeon]|nr:orotidine 5'-phosphate decarboxylase [Desulfurococcales archaeon]